MTTAVCAIARPETRYRLSISLSLSHTHTRPSLTCVPRVQKNLSMISVTSTKAISSPFMSAPEVPPPPGADSARAKAPTPPPLPQSKPGKCYVLQGWEEILSNDLTTGKCTLVLKLIVV